MRLANLARQFGIIRDAGLHEAAKRLAANLPGPLAAGALLLAYVSLEWISFIHEYKGVPVTPWNPGLGVAFALLVLGGPGYGLILFAGVLIAEIFVLRTELGWTVIMAMAAFIAASFTAAAMVARRYLHLDVHLRHVRDVLVLLATGAAAAAMSATLVSALLLAADELRITDLTQAITPLLVGDIIGIAIMTPLVLRLLLRWRDIPHKSVVGLVPEVLVFLLVIGVTLWMIVGASSPNAYKFFSLLFLPVVAAGVRHGIDGSCLALAATQLGLVALLRLHGYDAGAFTEFQVAMLALTMSGLLVGVVVSERERADLSLKAMQAEAARAARMNMVSGMASALAHEINQPMTAARALARSVQQLLASPQVDTERARTNLGNLVAQIDHAGGVVRRMRDFLRRGRPYFSTLDVGAMLNDALVLARPDAAANRTFVDLQLGESLPPVFGDRIQLQQVVLNLVHNAVESILEAGRADGRIRVRAYSSAEESAVEVSVADNGSGVPHDRPLFEPLTSTKKDGLGLGLSICASIVQAHGGRIWLQSSNTHGSEFRFSLPLQPRGDA